MGNSKIPCANSSGFKGVSRWGARWRAKIANQHLGYFDDPSEGHAVYMDAARARYGDFARAK
jgi:hypothetical protein